MSSKELLGGITTAQQAYDLAAKTVIEGGAVVSLLEISDLVNMTARQGATALFLRSKLTDKLVDDLRQLGYSAQWIEPKQHYRDGYMMVSWLKPEQQHGGP